MTNKIWAIRLVDSGEFQVYNGRSAWSKRGNAIRAFNLNRPTMDRHDYAYYESKNVYSIYELTEIVAMYEGLCK